MSCLDVSLATPLFHQLNHPLKSSAAQSIRQPFSEYNMAYRTNYPHPQHQWSLAPRGMTNATSSASPFSPSGHGIPALNVSEIVPRVYISDLAFAENPTLLSNYHITHILSTMPDKIFHPPPSLLPLQPTRFQVRIEDLPFAELAAHLPETTAFIHNALRSSPETRVLVHCAEGISRSVSVVAAYLMAQYGMTPNDAVMFIKGKRRAANPNFGFIQQLHEYARDSLKRSIEVPKPSFSPPSYS